jgi:hypothetical protein
MSGTTTPRIPTITELERAAAAAATAALGGERPTLVFRPHDLRQVGVTTPRDLWVPGDDIAVRAPVEITDRDDRRDLATHRLRKATLQWANRTGVIPRFTAAQFRDAVETLCAAADRVQCPSSWIAFTSNGLAEITLDDFAADDGRLAPGDVVWVSLEAFPLSWPDALTIASARILDGCRQPQAATSPDVTRLRPAA